MAMKYSLASDSELTYLLPTFAFLLATFLKIKAKKRLWKNFANTQVCHGIIFVLFVKTLVFFVVILAHSEVRVDRHALVCMQCLCASYILLLGKNFVSLIIPPGSLDRIISMSVKFQFLII